MQEYGVVIGQANPSFFDFNIQNLKNRPVAYEYVQLNIDEPQEDGSLKKLEVLGQVKAITSKHPFYDERTTPGAAWKQRELGAGDELIQVLATAKILGYINTEGGRSEVKRPRSPPMPGTQVYKASDELLKKLFTLGKEEIPLNVGYLLHRKNITIPISGKELHRHTAILAMTRYGKSYFAGRIIEQLLKQGATILVIDAHGDYANMTFSADNTPHSFYKERVTVYRPQGAEEYKSDHVKLLHLSVSQCGFSELCRLARIDGSLQRVILRRILKSLYKEKSRYSIDDIIDKLENEINEGNAEKQRRLARIIERLEDLKEQKIFTEGELDVKAFFKPMQLSTIFLSGITDNTQDVLVGMILRSIFNVKYSHEPWATAPIFIFVEEAHRFAAPPDEGGGKFSRDIIARIAAEGAKFGVFLTVISQRPRRIDPDILSNCSNLAILRVVNNQDQATIQAASEAFSEDLLSDLPALEQGEAVLVGPFVPVPVMIKTAERETKHGGKTPEIAKLLQEAIVRDQEEKEKMNRRLY
ncbi:ATP-binding protein [Candidatus Bathyarchaeota archaeon]|nr:ATP-binding protein [Candidatus Bathyarchaeota archaeon]